MPYCQFTVPTQLPASAVVEKLRSVTGPDSLLVGKRLGIYPPFLGAVTADSFRIRRNISGRNSFLPQINGEIEPLPTGSIVHVRMWIHPFAIVFMLIWLGFIGKAAISDKSSSPILFWGMFLFGLFLPIFGFVPEVRRARRMLTQIIAPNSPAR